jgi:hypothetical protein
MNIYLLIFSVFAGAFIYLAFTASVIRAVNKMIEKELEEGSYFTRCDNIRKEIKKVYGRC